MIVKQELLKASYGGQPVWNSDCEQLLKAVNIIRQAYGKTHKITTDLIRLEMQVKTLHDRANKKG